MSGRGWFVDCCDADGAPLSLDADKRYIQLVGVPATYLWIGSSTDEVVGEVLDQQGAAQQGLVPDKVNDSPLAVAMFRFVNNSSDAWRAQTADIGDYDTVSVMKTMTFRTRQLTLPVSTKGINVKRAVAGPNAGAEVALDVAGMITAAVDNGPSAVFAGLNTDLVDEIWHTVVELYNFTAGTYTISTEGETGTPIALPASPPTPTSLVLQTIGAGSTVAPTGRFSALGMDVLHFAITQGAEVETLDSREIAENLACDQYLKTVKAAQG